VNRLIARRGTHQFRSQGAAIALIAKKEASQGMRLYRFDNLQGDGETVFFDF
jgi:hypothetical protein